MRTAEYWQNAALLREIAVQEGATLTAKDILRLYDEALGDINREIKNIKANYQKRYGLNESKATYFLTQAQQDENLKNLIYALEQAPNERARRDILERIQEDGLSVRAYAARTERYKAVEDVIYSSIKKLAAAEIIGLGDMLKSAYKESYYGLMDDTAKGLDVGINFAILSDNAIDEAVSAKWHGKRFSERIWSNTDRLAQEAQELVIKSLMSGESLSKTSKKLADSFDVSKYRSTTLIHTETAHVHAMADMKAYKDLGAQEYKYLATLDYKTCETCQPLDGKVFKLSEAREGVNYPVMHPRCRCTTTINMDYTNRRARNPLTGKNEIVDGNMTYQTWLNSLTPEQKAAWKLSIKKDNNKTADKLKNVIDKSSKNVIINKKSIEAAVSDVHYIGKIDVEKYQTVTDKRIITNQVVLTENRKQHIIERRGQKFYDEYSQYFSEIIAEPDFIFKDNREDTALVSKTLVQNGENVNLVLRLAVEGDNPEYKNSIITAIKENKKRFAQRLRNDMPLYKRVDKNE